VSERRNPYVGLVPYTEADAEWFFGRDREVRLIIANLRAARLTLLYGASGAGKSSTLLAGVLPKLHALAAEQRAIAADDGRGGTALAERASLAVTVFRDWRDPPLAPLAAALHAAVVEVAGDAVEPWDGEEPFIDWLRGLARHARTLLVVLDQFEEYFQYHAGEKGAGTFAGEFPAIVNDHDLRVHFMLSLREDAWAQLDRFKGEIPELFGNYLRVDYLDREAAEEAIVRPVGHFNDLLEPGEQKVELEEELVEAILDDVRTGRLALAEGRAAGPDPTARHADERVETPYLQLVMERLWVAGTEDGARALTRATLKDLGGAASIVSSHLKDAMAALTPADQAIAADVFAYLVTPSKTKIAHRASDLAWWAKRPEADVLRVLEDLTSSERRILRRVPPPGDEDVNRYEIFHDVLAEAVLEWSTDNRQQRQRAEARKARARARRRKALFVLGVLVVAALVVTTIIAMLDDPGRSEDDVRRDRAASSKAIAGRAEAWLASDPERSLILALDAYRAWPTPEAVRALGRSYASSRVRAAYVEQSSPPCTEDDCAPRRVRSERPAPVALEIPADDPFFIYATEQPRRNASASLSSDGQTVALIRNGDVHVWPTAGGEVVTLPGVREAAQVAFIGAGRRLLVLTKAGTLFLAEGLDGVPSVRRAVRDVRFAAASADGRYFATSDRRGNIRVARTSRPGRPLEQRSLRFRETQFDSPEPAGLLFSPTDAGVVAAWGERGRPVVWSWRGGGEPRGEPDRPEREPSAAFPVGAAAPVAAPVAAGAPGPSGKCSTLPGAFSTDGRLLLITAPNGSVKGWSTGDLRQELRIRRATACPEAVRVDPEGDRMLVATGNVATIFSVPGGRAQATLGGHRDVITDAAFSPSGARIATAGADGARVWDARTGIELMELSGRGLDDRLAAVESVTFTSDGRFAVTVDEDGVARLWDLTTRDRLGRRYRRIVSAAFAGDGRIVATRQNGRIMSLPQDGGARPVLEGRVPGGLTYAVSASGAPDVVAAISWRGINPVAWLHQRGRDEPRRLGRGYYHVSISGDGSTVAILSWRRLRIWRSGPGDGSWVRLPLSRRERRAFDTRAELSDDGRRVLITSYGRNARIVDVEGGDSRRLVDESTPEIFGGDFSPDGKRLLTTGGGDALLWDTGTGRVARALTGHGGGVANAVFSTPDGRHIATLDGKGIVRIFDSAGGAEISALPGGPGARFALAFDSRSNAALTLGPGGLELRRCEACQPAGWLLEHARARVTRTPAEIERIRSSAMSP
jgi:WD40 repeat protein